MDQEVIKAIQERLDFIEFRQELLFNNSEIDRLLFEYRITHKQYTEIMDVMDKYREMIGRNEKVFHGTFEDDIYKVVPQHDGNYHFCEYMVRAFMNEGRWEEVFPKLYGDMPKYKNLRD